MSVELKIKSKHLALEPAIIRFEERKLEEGYKKNSLIEHRRWNVRNEARATYLARAYIKGMPYSVVEKGCNEIERRNLYIVPRVHAMVYKYKDRSVTQDDIRSWINKV